MHGGKFTGSPLDIAILTPIRVTFGGTLIADQVFN